MEASESPREISLFEALNTIAGEPITVSFCTKNEVRLGVNRKVTFPAGVAVQITGGNLIPDQQGYVTIRTSDGIEIQLPYEIATDLIVEVTE